MALHVLENFITTIIDEIHIKYMLKMDQYHSKTIFLRNVNAKLAKIIKEIHFSMRIS